MQNRLQEFLRINLLLVSLFFWTLGSTGIAQDGKPEFDGQTAFNFLYKQVEFGPRIPGSEGHKKARESFVEWFEECGADVSVQTFKADVPIGPKASFGSSERKGYNIIAHFGGYKAATYLFAAHYDTRPWSDSDLSNDPDAPVPGANDGASGVAVLLELAGIFAEFPPPVPIDIVLFDLEDSGHSGNNESYCLGSSYYATHTMGKNPVGAILLDMIGDDDLLIPKEYYSAVYARDWTNFVFDIAEDIGSWAFEDIVGPAVYDDHVPLIRNGIPTVDLIDFDYEYWHTPEDTPEKCSAESLEQVGNVLVHLVYNL